MSNETDKENEGAEDVAAETTAADPVRKWTLIVLGSCVVLMFFYLIADRVTPYTTQARVHALVVPVASQVSGIVVEVLVENNEYVESGQELFRIDPSSYELAVETAKANMQAARQATGVSAANVDAAIASMESVRAGVIRSEQDAVRLRRIKDEDPGAISDRRLEQAESSLMVSRSQFAAAQANVEKARQDLGKTGDQNSRILQAQAGLDQANLNLSRTTIRAAGDGLVTDVRLDRGNFAAAGSPQMTFVGIHNIWVQADFTENNLGHIRPGDAVQIVFDSLPARVISGTILTTGFGVDIATAPLGSLPSVDNNRQWLRDAQRFPVQIEFTLENAEDRLAVRVGAQASVIAYTGNNWLFNAAGRIYIRFVSILTYAF
jgi:multidrug resistance efflux pump